VTPDFDELIDEEGSPAELDEMRRVHDLLVSASPPPSLDHQLRRPPRIRSLVPRTWAIAAVALATALSVVIGAAIGYTAAHGPGFQTGFTRPMHGIGPAATASALIKVGNEDTNGNRPLRISVQALPALPNNAWYELYLTKKGKPVVACGIFQTGHNGTAHVSMNAPADLAEYDGWIVTALIPGHSPRPLLTT
jgi:hypothetical protein